RTNSGAMQASPQRVDNTGAFAGGDPAYSGDFDASTAVPHSARGIHSVKSRAAQQKLQQQQQQPTGPLSNNRMRTLTMSTPHLTQNPKHAHFNFVNHLALRDHTGSNRAIAQPAMVAVVPLALQPCFAGTSLALLPSAVGYNQQQQQQLVQMQTGQCEQQQLQDPQSWWGGGGSRASLATEQRGWRQRIASVQLVRSPLNRKCETGNGKSATPTASAEEAEPEQHGCCSDSRRRRLNTADSVFRAITPSPL
uniref:HIPK3 n=2 Tax=Macrostomum lignano TaxID=282301 RepID=A0A1I8HPE3_9PLAT